MEQHMQVPSYADGPLMCASLCRSAEANYVRREQDLGLYLKEAEAFLATQKREKKRKHADL